MKSTQKVLVKAALWSSLLASLAFLGLVYLSHKYHGLYGNSNQLETAPEPLAYESIGNFPPLEESSMALPREKKFTLEIGSCQDKVCITKTLKTLSQKGVDAFYTPSKMDGEWVFSIRRGIFSSRPSAERAQATLNIEKKIESIVVEL